MLYYAKLTERACVDPQEERAQAVLRAKSLQWLQTLEQRTGSLFVFRGETNRATHAFLDCPNHRTLHDALDADPLISHSVLEIEPLLTPVEMAQALEGYLGVTVLREEDWKNLQFAPNRLQEDGSYFLARKVVAPFSPLLSVADQNRIHKNTLISQKAHSDGREVADFNPVAKPVGILIMEALSIDDVRAHVSECEVFVDSSVTIERILTLQQASAANQLELRHFMRGEFRSGSV